MVLISLKRLFYSIPTLFFISLLVFLSIRLLPGDPVDFLLGEKGRSPEARAQLEENLGLNKPLYVQYFLFVSQALKGDLGRSTATGQKVSEEFFSRFPATLELAVSSVFLALLLGIPLGILCALLHNSVWDRLVMGLSLTGYSMSIFWWGLILILFFSIQLEWTPTSGRIGLYYDIPHYTGFILIDAFRMEDPWISIKSFLSHLILPTLTLATIPFVSFVRMTRSSLIETLHEDFVRTARAKGLSFYTVVVKHAFRNALLPVVTVIGFMFSSLITGAVLTETVFAWPGIGRWLVKAVEARDYPALQGGILIISVLVVLINLLVDLSYIKLDPRVQKGIG
ncbi:MAG: ABC transporter permease [Bdellovibrionales bacterium]|nr:ABC transporter permease [Bdellovibrionales bacterium]